MNPVVYHGEKYTLRINLETNVIRSGKVNGKLFQLILHAL